MRLANYQSRGGATNETRQEAHCGLTLMLRFGFCESFGVTFGFNITEHPLLQSLLKQLQLALRKAIETAAVKNVYLKVPNKK